MQGRRVAGDWPSAGSCNGPHDGGWVDLRAPGGRLLARYDPGRGLLEVRRSGDAVIFDLRAPDLASPKMAGSAGGGCSEDDS